MRIGTMIRRRTAALFVIAGGLALATQAQAQPAPAPPPSGGWVVDESGDTCAMARPVSGAPAATLIVRSYPGSGRYDLMLASAAWPRNLRSSRELSILRLSPSGASYDRPTIVVPLGGTTGRALRFGSLPVEFLAAFARSSEMVIEHRNRRIGAYTVPQTAAVTRAFRECEAAKLIEWGADPAGFGTGTTQATPVGEPDSWLHGIPIPRSVRVISAILRLDVGSDGRATRCTIMESNNQDYSAAACRLLMERARYEPARDASGNPVRSVAIHRSEFVKVTQFHTTG